MARYWLFLDSKVQGPYEIPYLRKVPGFTLLTQVCAEGERTWRMADEVIDIKSYFLAPPRASSVVFDSGNTVAAPQPEQEAHPSELSVIDPQPSAEIPSTETVLPSAEEPPKTVSSPPPLRIVCTLCGFKNARGVTSCMKCGTVLNVPAESVAPEPGSQTPSENAPAETTPKAGPASQLLRIVCSLCGFKNPRDVKSCMKCGNNLSGQEASAVQSTGPKTTVDLKASSPAMAVSVSDTRSNTMVEMPVTRILILLALASVLGAGGFIGHRLWQSHHRLKAPPKPPEVVAAKPVTHPVHKVHHPRRSYSKRAVVALPGVHKSVISKPQPRPVVEPVHLEPAQVEAAPEASASYKVIEEATPLRQRHSAPLSSTYATKRRGERELWTEQSEQAVQQVQRSRIYGGQRTIQRNAEILMQILRDREYNTAFESGKRISLYNDLDWGASQKDGPVYEVRLTFSGGKEPDGTPRKPLRFAFNADLERGSVDPGGSEQLYSNTMHAFFDESRIPPEERRAIAKDTEEVVLAAQPDASPLALDTVARRFVSTYSTGALARVAGAFHLELVNKKLVHDPRLTRSAAEPPKSDSQPVAAAAPLSRENVAPEKKEKVMPSPRSGAIDYRMDNIGGRERRISLQTPSRATPGKLWETLTGYDRLKQFVPDLLVSEREGQDGSAIIVRTVSLTRLFFFVFKVNLHLRIIEHPQQHTLEFERIAGDFESFRGSIQIEPNGTSGSVFQLRATVIPKGRMPNWVLRDMTRHFLAPAVDAIRSRAES
ncbi:MAG: SRPBCC family protein [Elusimicrobiota bacterium]|jgi:ribosomal protein L40E